MIGGIGSIAAGAIQSSNARKQQNQQNIFNAEQADKQFEYSKEQSEQQYQNDLKTMAQQREWDLEDRQFAIDNPTKIIGEVDYEKMVASAEAAGINPLTAIRNGGSAGFSASSQPSAPLSRTAPTRHAALRQAPAMGVANTDSPIAAGIAGFLDNFDPFQDQKREMEYGLVQAQIANLNASTLAMGSPNRPASFNVPTYGAKTGEQRQSGAAGNLSRIHSDSLGLSWNINPNNTPAQVIEDQYAEIPANIIGTANVLRDMSDEYFGKDYWSQWRNPTLSDVGRGVSAWWNRTANRDYNRNKTMRSGFAHGGGGW